MYILKMSILLGVLNENNHSWRNDKNIGRSEG